MNNFPEWLPASILISCLFTLFLGESGPSGMLGPHGPTGATGPTGRDFLTLI